MGKSVTTNGENRRPDLLAFLHEFVYIIVNGSNPERMTGHMLALYEVGVLDENLDYDPVGGWKSLRPGDPSNREHARFTGWVGNEREGELVANESRWYGHLAIPRGTSLEQHIADETREQRC